MEDSYRERSAATPGPAAPPAADSSEEEEDGDDDENREESAEDGTSEERRSTKTEVLVLDSDGELENIEEALVAPKLAEAGPNVETESGVGRVKGEGTTAAAEDEVQEAEHEVRAAIIELAGMIAQFLPEGKEHAGRIAAAITAAAAAAAATTTSSASTATAIAIALLCSRCLHAHLGTQAVALSSQTSSPFPFASGAKMEGEGGAGGEEEEEEAFLSLLKQRCGVRESSEAGNGSSRKVGTPEAIKLDGGSGDAGCGPGGCERERPRQKGRGSLHDKRGVEWQPTPTEIEEAPCSLSSEAAEALVQGTPMMEGEARSGTEENRKDACRTAIGRDNDAGSGGNQVPEFLLQLEAGWVLASAVWEGVALLERARDYERAVELLIQLLATR